MKFNDDPNSCLLLAEKIAEIFKSGLAISRDDRNYIDSTFSTPSMEALARILRDPSNSETETLLELIFFPDETIQIELEDLLERYPFEKEDEQKVLTALFLQKLETTLGFPDTDERLTMEAPRMAVAQFVARLNIFKKIDPRLIHAIDKYVEEKYRPRFKVRLRNTRFDDTENKIVFIDAFFAKMKAEISIVSACFDFLLAFFDELKGKDDSDIYRCLMEKKRYYVQNLQKILEAEAQLVKSNMETLFLQGARMVYFDKNDARKKIGLVDKISQVVFGKTEHVGLMTMDVDLCEFNREDGLNKMFLILS